MGWADGHLTALDFETTSSNPREARIVTASLVVINPQHPKAIVTEWLVVPEEPIPAEATAIHGISTGHAREHGRPLGEVLRELTHALAVAWTSSTPLLAMNASYDLTVLAAELDRVGFPAVHPDPELRPVIDPLVCDRGLDRYRRGSRKLAALCEHYRARHDGAHNATADALAAARVAWKLARRYPELAEMSLPELHHQQARWHAEWAAGYQDYLRTSGKEPDAVVDGSWPVLALDGAR